MSDYRIGVVILPRFEDVMTKPVAHVLRTLLPAEKNFSQIEKESLAIVFSVKNFIDLCMEENLFSKCIIVHYCQFLDPKKISLHIQLTGCNVGEPFY